MAVAEETASPLLRRRAARSNWDNLMILDNLLILVNLLVLLNMAIMVNLKIWVNLVILKKSGNSGKCCDSFESGNSVEFGNYD